MTDGQLLQYEGNTIYISAAQNWRIPAMEFVKPMQIIDVARRSATIFRHITQRLSFRVQKLWRFS